MKSSDFRGISAIAVCAFLALSGCRATIPLSDMAEVVNSTLDPSFETLRPGDKLELSFPNLTSQTNRDDVTESLVVPPDGRMVFPRISDEIQVAGKTLDTVRTELRRLYGRDLQIDSFNLALIEPADRNAYVIGEVENPGPVPVPRGRINILNAVGEAGGYKEKTAKEKIAILMRVHPRTGEQQVWRLDLRPENWRSSQVLWMQENDVLFIPNKAIDDVNIIVDQYLRQMLPVPIFVGS